MSNGLEMAEKDPIDLIKEQLNRIEELTGLHSEHEAFKQWYSDTRMILEKVFGSKSIHYQNFLALRFRELNIKAFSSPEIEKINSARYKRDLDGGRNILRSAIKELTLDRTLFKKIRSTPKTVEVSIKGEYYISSGISTPEIIKAIESAFEGSELSPIYGAKILKEDQPIKNLFDKMKTHRLGIYDLSIPRSDDTLIELGMALGLGKDVIIILKKGNSLPESMKELNRIEYESPSDLNDKLKKFRLS